MDRRSFLVAGACAAAVPPTILSSPGWAGEASGPIERHVREAAQALASQPFAAPAEKPDNPLNAIGYDEWRDVRFRREQSLFHGEERGFEVQFFPAGYIYRTPVEVFLVKDGAIEPLSLKSSMFDWGALGKRIPPPAELQFSGIRIHAFLNESIQLDELAVFLGASYFRALGRGHTYGLSARGLALKTHGSEPEEFPLFRSFWIDQPADRSHIVIHALLDSQSVTGAYRYAIWPGAATMMDVSSTLFPRVELANVGIAPLTSMFVFDTHDPAETRDFRPAVHDSDGLSVLAGRSEWTWRPLMSPRDVQANRLPADALGGFGLMQRDRDFANHQDLEARYERRPSAWVEPKGDWGEGQIELVEIPAREEYFDNIVAYWRPSQALKPNEPRDFNYRLSWCDTAPLASPHFYIGQTRIGEGPKPGTHRFVIDFHTTGVGALQPLADSVGLWNESDKLWQPIEAILTSTAGALTRPIMQTNPFTNGLRLNFELDPKEAAALDLRLLLRAGNRLSSEVWLYRWETDKPPPAPAPAAAAPAETSAPKPSAN